MPRADGVLEARTTLEDDEIMLEGGRRVIKITAQASELIGLPNYSNVTIGPLAMTDYVEIDAEPGSEEYRNARKDALRQATEDVEEVLAERRGQVLNAIRKFQDEQGY
jgi:hypothetical protein